MSLILHVASSRCANDKSACPSPPDFWRITLVWVVTFFDDKGPFGAGRHSPATYRLMWRTLRPESRFPAGDIARS